MNVWGGLFLAALTVFNEPYIKTGVAHNALDDATNQAFHLLKLLKKLP